MNRRHRDFQSRALPTELPGPVFPTSDRQKPTGRFRFRAHMGTVPGGLVDADGPYAGPLRQKRRARRRSGFRCSHSGGGIRTRDLRVMSPMSYQTAPPRSKILIVSVLVTRVNSGVGARFTDPIRPRPRLVRMTAMNPSPNRRSDTTKGGRESGWRPGTRVRPGFVRGYTSRVCRVRES